MSACKLEPGCITCGDVAVELTVQFVNESDACCVDDDGHTESVAIELVPDVHTGDRLLVHAGVAIELLREGMTSHALCR